MADRRVRIAKDKAELVKTLTSLSETEHPPFSSYAAAVAFAAAYGAKHDAFTPVRDFCRDPEPIRTEIFRNQNLDSVISLVALYREMSPEILADSDEAEEKRISVFESYANGGLGLLSNGCIGITDGLDAIALIICQ